MREIFIRRGKRVDNGKWVYGNIVFTRSGRAFLLEGSFFSGESHEGNFKHGEIYGTEVIPETIGQFAGLTDKNGTKIFEGDIVRERGGESCQGFYEIDNVLIVEIPNTLVNLIMGRDCGCEYKVIGNIHDNPELLNGR